MRRATGGHLRRLFRRSKIRDRTPYDTFQDSGKFMMFWMQRLATAVVTGDARRALNAISAKAALLGGCH